MFALQKLRVLEVEDHETAFPDLVNVGTDEVGEGSVIARAVRVQPFEPVHVEDVHGWRGRQCREGLVLNVNSASVAWTTPLSCRRGNPATCLKFSAVAIPASLALMPHPLGVYSP